MKKLFLVCCLAAFCTCNAMAQETVDSTMVDSTAIEALPLDNPVSIQRLLKHYRSTTQ